MQVLLGPRRVGKTSAMQLYMQELTENLGVKSDRLVYFNFEDERVHFLPEQLDLILQAWKELHPSVQLEDCFFSSLMKCRQHRMGKISQPDQ